MELRSGYSNALYKFFAKYKKDDTGESDEEESDGEEIKTPHEIFETLKEILEKDAYSLKKHENLWGFALQNVLWNSKLSTLSILNLMLSYGAEINSRDDFSMTPLHVALKYNRGEDVIRALLEKGADVTATNIFGQSTLCFALVGGVSEKIVQLLLDAGCPIDLCRKHNGFPLHCATALKIYQTSSNKDIIQLLIKTTVDLNAVDEDGRSSLCHILNNGSELWVVDLLMAAGGSLNACTLHATPLHCATFADASFPRADVIEKLLKLVKEDDPVKLLDPTPLQHVLTYLLYPDMEVIKILFHHLQGSRTIVDEHGNSLLHLAVMNRFCRLGVIEFFAKSGMEVNLVNNNGETPLHLAVKNFPRRSSIVKMLLKVGSSVNAVNASGENPLQHAVNLMVSPFPPDVEILKMLFIAGSRIENAAVSRFVNCFPYKKNYRKNSNYYNMLLKCYFLENPGINIHLSEYHENYAALSAFRADCERELHSMKSTIVGEGRTLRDLLNDHSSHQLVEYDFNQLEIIANNTFPVYFDIIATKIISRLAMEEILREAHVYTYISGSKERVALNYHVVCNIADKLTDDNLLRFILAFRKIDRGMCTARASNENAFRRKRGGEQSKQCPKHPKLQI